jgi:hypothetical protein
MAIDDEVAIFGSGNMDSHSWHDSQEVNIVVASTLLVKEWMDLFKISQNTHLCGVINPLLPETPKQQIAHMLAKQNTQPRDFLPTSPPVINNSSASSISNVYADNSNKNNFNAYYNTFRGIYSSPTDPHDTTSSSNVTNTNTNTSLTNNDTANYANEGSTNAIGNAVSNGNIFTDTTFFTKSTAIGNPDNGTETETTTTTTTTTLAYPYFDTTNNPFLLDPHNDNITYPSSDTGVTDTVCYPVTYPDPYPVTYPNPFPVTYSDPDPVTYPMAYPVPGPGADQIADLLQPIQWPLQ